MPADFKVDLNLDHFDLNIKIGIPKINTRYIKPAKWKDIPEHKLKYSDAAKLAKDIVISDTGRIFCIVSGSFIFGDFIEALFVEKNLHAKTMQISTLSMSQNNVDSLQNLIKGGYVDDLGLIVSDYFFSHERHGLIPYIYENLDIEDKFQLAVAGSHCKTCIFELHNGTKVTMHGSANLRSSACLEQFEIEINAPKYEFIKEYQDTILEHYKTIKNPLRVSKLWQAVQHNMQDSTRQ